MTIGGPRSGSRTSRDPALTSSARRRLSAIAPSAHPGEPAELFLFNRQPRWVTLPSPPAPASLRSGAGAAWKGQSCEFAPALGPWCSRSGPPGLSLRHPASPPLPALAPHRAARPLPLAESVTPPLHAGDEELGLATGTARPLGVPSSSFDTQHTSPRRLAPCFFPVSASSRAALHLLP